MRGVTAIMRRRVRWAVLLGCLFAPLLGMFAARGEDNRRLLHAILVVVNGHRVTQGDLDEAAEYIFKRAFPGRPFSTLMHDEAEELSARAMQELIRVNLIIDESEKQKLELDRERKDRYYRIMKVDPATANTTVRRFVEADAIFEKIMSLDGKGYAKPGPKEIRDFWLKHKDTLFVTQRRVKVRHLFLDTAFGEPKLLKSQMEMMRGKLLQTPMPDRVTLFGKMAEEFSQGRFRSEGGLLLIGGDPDGWFNQDFPNRGRNTDEIFPEAMVRGVRGLQAAGDLGDVIQSEKGFHLLLLEAAKGGEQVPFGTAQTYIEWHLNEIAKRQYQTKWMKRKLETSAVTWNDGTPYPQDRILSPNKDDEKTGEDAIRRQLQ